MMINEVNMKREGTSINMPWSRDTERFYSPSLICGYLCDKYVTIPREVQKAVLVFEPKRTSPDEFRFSPNLQHSTFHAHPWIIHGTARAELHCEMDSVLTRQWASGNRYFRIEYEG